MLIINVKQLKGRREKKKLNEKFGVLLSFISCLLAPSEPSERNGRRENISLGSTTQKTNDGQSELSVV